MRNPFWLLLCLAAFSVMARAQEATPPEKKGGRQPAV
jgi:hypothetical protein